MKVALDHSSCFADIRSKDVRNLTPFLSACGNFGLGYSKPVFSFLFERGANISNTDVEGRSGLHLCLSGAGINPPVRVEQESEALIYLLEKGAGMGAKDRLGRSVSHAVYSKGSSDRFLGSYRRDLWDFVLTVSGHNILEIRGDFQRVGRYKRRYTRADFQRLWAGSEALCPYPNDLQDIGNRLDGDESTSEEESSDDASAVESSDDSPTDEGSEDELRDFSCPDPNCEYCRRRWGGNRPGVQGRDSCRTSARGLAPPRDSTLGVDACRESPIPQTTGEGQASGTCWDTLGIEFENPWKDAIGRGARSI